MLPTNGQAVMAEQQLTVEVPHRTGGRPIKFTPERIQQIRNLLERGMSREQIAETLEVTVNSLAVTCSKLDISLRRPQTVDYGCSPQNRPRPPKPRPLQSRLGLELFLSYRGRQKAIELPDSVIDYLLIEAAFNDLPIGVVIANTLKNALAE